MSDPVPVGEAKRGFIRVEGLRLRVWPILFTILLALAIARSTPAARTALVGFFQALGDAMLILVRWVVLAAPIGIFALVLPLAAHAGASLAGAIGFYIVAYSFVSVVMVLLMYPVVRAVAYIEQAVVG